MRLISFGGTELKPGSASRSLPAPSAAFDVVWSGQRGSPVEDDVCVPLPPARVNRGRAENRPAGVRGEGDHPQTGTTSPQYPSLRILIADRVAPPPAPPRAAGGDVHLMSWASAVPAPSPSGAGPRRGERLTICWGPGRPGSPLPNAQPRLRQRKAGWARHRTGLCLATASKASGNSPVLEDVESATDVVVDVLVRPWDAIICWMRASCAGEKSPSSSSAPPVRSPSVSGSPSPFVAIGSTSRSPLQSTKEKRAARCCRQTASCAMSTTRSALH